MHLKTALALVAAVPVLACASDPKTIELPGGQTEEQARAAEPRERTWVERALGANSEPNVGPCPLMGVLSDASRQVEFATEGAERMSNVAFTAEVRGVRGLCRYTGTDPITMNLEIDMAFGRGPAAQGQQKTYRYWVAVTRRGRSPIAKQYFDVRVDFPRDGVIAETRETIEEIVIPRANGEISGENFEILVGFDVTPAQLEFNRAGKRFTMGAGRGG